MHVAGRWDEKWKRENGRIRGLLRAVVAYCVCARREPTVCVPEESSRQWGREPLVRPSWISEAEEQVASYRGYSSLAKSVLVGTAAGRRGGQARSEAIRYPRKELRYKSDK